MGSVISDFNSQETGKSEADSLKEGCQLALTREILLIPSGVTAQKDLKTDQVELRNNKNCLAEKRLLGDMEEIPEGKDESHLGGRSSHSMASQVVGQEHPMEIRELEGCQDVPLGFLDSSLEGEGLKTLLGKPRRGMGGVTKQLPVLGKKIALREWYQKELMKD